MKQTKLRRKRVFRYAVLYFVLLIIFVALIVAPTVAGPMMQDGAWPKALEDYKLVQPTGQDNNDTTTEPTGGPAGGDDGDDADLDDLDDFERLRFLVI